MKLISLTLENFKGARSFKLQPNGDDIDVFGDNATGKTTLSDALHWLLFDKDSTGAKEFGIKTLETYREDGHYADSDGRLRFREPMHNLEHAVTAELETAGGILTLKKVYREVWTKQRGSATSSFTGHTSDYFVDGVPVPLKDYKSKIAELGDEATIRLVTNPDAFSALPWKERRAIVIDVCGDVGDAEVIASSDKLARIPELLGSRSVDDHRKVLAARRKEINAEIERIPVRIAEVERGLPENPGMSPEAISGEIARIDKGIDKLRESRSRIEAGGEVAEKRKRLAEIDADLLTLDNERQAAVNAAEAAADAERASKRQLVTQAKNAHEDLITERDRTQRTIAENADAIARKQGAMESLRKSWNVLNSTAFESADGLTVASVCPTCEQALPAEKVQAARDKALADFNRNKAEKLSAMTTEGAEIKAQADDLAGKNEALRKNIDAVMDGIKAANIEIERLQAELDAVTTADVPLNIPKRDHKQAEKDVIADDIIALETDAAPQREKIDAEVARLTTEKAAFEQQARDIAAIATGKARIDELDSEHKTLAREFEQLEADLYLTEEFIRAKVGMLEDRINARFEPVRFRLFSTLINGGVEECCETLGAGGVPYASGLNAGARTQAGMAIIRVLQEHYGVHAPIFVDNRESVTALPKMECQVIGLVVSEKDKTLRVERKA